MTDTEPTVDLGAVRWSTELRRHRTETADGMYDVTAMWHVIATEEQPDGYDDIVYDLWVGRATDSNGRDIGEPVAEAIARRLDGWNHDIDQAERDAYARGFDAGERAGFADRDAERRWDLGNALGWELGDDPTVEDDTPSWAQLMRSVRTLRAAQVPAVAPEVVAEALEVNCPDRALAHDSVWTPARILEMLAEHGLKVVRA